ncbi:hypothetical protein GCM10010376_21120 [Streptomyces violaceusniger]
MTRQEGTWLPTTPCGSAWSGSAAPHRIHYLDCGTSGGVWGLERGYCLMIGGEGTRRRSGPTPPAPGAPNRPSAN